MATAKKEVVVTVSKVRTVKLSIKEINVYPDGAGVIVTAQSKDNPSANGVFRQSAGQLQRLASKSGAGSVIALKLLAQLGGCVFEMDTTAMKAGDVWKNEATGETGAYEKDHIRTNNETINLGAQGIHAMLGATISAQMAQAPAAKAPSQEIVDDAEPFESDNDLPN